MESSTQKEYIQLLIPPMFTFYIMYPTTMGFSKYLLIETEKHSRVELLSIIDDLFGIILQCGCNYFI